MKRNILVIFAMWMTLALHASVGDRAVAPTPSSSALVGTKWSRGKPIQSNTGFKGEKNFRNPGKRSAVAYVKSVGDGTEIRGNVIYSDDWTETNMAYGIYSLTASENLSLKVLKIDSDFNSSMCVYDGKDKYYRYQVEQSWGGLYYIRCSVYDVATWAKVADYEPAVDWANVPYSSSMTYDQSDGKIYAVTYSSDLSTYCLSTQNSADGSFSKVASLPFAFMTLAASPEGRLYGLTEDAKLYEVGKDGQVKLIGDTGLDPMYAQSMTFDGQTGKLYWAFTTESGAALYEVNTNTASVYKISDMPHDEELVGLYVVNAAVQNDAPAAVEDLKFTPVSDGSLSGTVSCAAPTATVGGTELTGTVHVEVWCGDEKLLEEDAMPGATVSKSDCVFEANKLYSLYAIASNGAGSGPKSSITLFVGKDRASAPTNVVLDVADGKASLHWDAPEKGANDGYFNPAETKYRIVRYAGSAAEGETVATTAPGVTSYEESLPPTTAIYHYAVTALSDEGDGGTAVSNGVLSVGYYELPFSDDFSDGDLSKQLYTIVDVDNDGHDNQNEWFWKEDEKLMQFCSDGNTVGNDWLITPAIHLDGNHIYDFSFTVNMGAPANLKATLGTSTNPSDHTVELLDLKDLQDSYPTTHSATFEVPTDGIYYIGFYAYSGVGSNYMNLFDVSVAAGQATNVPNSVANLEVEPRAEGVEAVDIRFNAPETLLNGTSLSQPFEVVVYRDGSEWKKIAVDAGQLVQTTDDTPGNGSRTYRIVALYDGKEGLSAEKTVWVGYDVAEPVKSMTVRTTNGNMYVQLDWEAPEKGQNGGYFNPEEVAYSVWRSIDGRNYEQIAEQLKVLSFTDTQIGETLQNSQEAYYYAVTADTKGGSSEADAKYIVVGKPYTIPCRESFPNGQFDIYPWTTDAIDGSFGWECLRSDEAAGVSPQDNDRGFIKFMNSWSDWTVDSRLKTPVFTLKGSTRPSFSFFMFHWNAADVEYDNGATKVAIEISVDGGDFQQIGDLFTAGYTQQGWVEHRIALDDYKDAECVQFALRGMTDNDWMYFYVDNIHVEEQEEYDLAVAGFSGSEKSGINQDAVYTLEYFNRGLATADDYEIAVYRDGVQALSLRGDALAPGETKSVELQLPMTAAQAGEDCEVYAEIVYDKDGNKDNNTSDVVVTSVEGSFYPTVEQLEATVVGSDVELTWDAPAIPTNVQPTTDGVEDYEAFAIDGIGQWTTYDGDMQGAGSYNTLPDYPHRGENQAFQVWNPSQIDATAADYPGLQPRSGNQCFIAWYADTAYGFDDPVNDDYLISPEVMGGTEVRFYVRCINGEQTGETYQLMYSSTTRDADAFRQIEEGEATGAWEEVVATLPADARYFAIHYTASLKTGILVDDITYTSAIYSLKLEGYNVFRDGFRLNEAPVESLSYRDESVPSGNHAYQVSAVYDRGESEASDPVVVSKDGGVAFVSSAVRIYGGRGCVAVEADAPCGVAIYSMDGRLVAADSVVGDTRIPVLPGIYLVKATDRVWKVSVSR